MRGRRLVLGASVLAWLAPGMAAQAASLSDDYLVGRWTTGSKEACTRTEHEQTVFRDDGTFATEHGGKAVAVGFWQAEDDQIDMHILASTEAVEPSLRSHLAGNYHYLPVRALAFDIGDDSFRMVQSIGGELKGLNVFRCP